MTAPRTIGPDLLAQYPLPAVPEDAGKEERGRLLVIGGSRELAGAARLAGEAALRAGAGKLQIGTAATIAPALAVALPEARVIGHEETEEGCIAASSVESLLGWAASAQAVTIGCGMRKGDALVSLLEGLADLASLPLVLDAAALDCLPRVEKRIAGREAGVILLPHPGEMARLLDCTEEEAAADPVAAVRRASDRFGAIALVKGPESFVADPSGDMFRLVGGGVGLATSGSGDMLAGLVGGLCARGAPPLAALLWGIWIHAEAGRILSDRVGRVGFLARELVDLIPGLLPANRP